MGRLRQAIGGSTRLIAVGVICALVVGATGAVAASLITGKDIKNNSIAAKDLKKKLRQKINKVESLVLGVPGPGGPQGPAGADFTAAVATLVPDTTGDGPAAPAWGARVSTCGANPPQSSAVLEQGHLNLRLPGAAGADDAASATFNGFNGLKLADLSHISYHAAYEQGGADQHGGAPYFRIFTGAGSSIIFSPNTQPNASTDEGEWREYVVTEGGVRYNDDGGNNPDISWNQLIDDHGEEVISQVRIQAGCAGSFSADTVASADQLTVVALGERVVFDFGG